MWVNGVSDTPLALASGVLGVIGGAVALPPHLFLLPHDPVAAGEGHLACGVRRAYWQSSFETLG